MGTQDEGRYTGGQRFFDAPSITVAAHELKSPLALIRQLSLELQQGTDVNLVLLEQIRLTAERSLRLTSNLTKLDRLQTVLFDNETLNPRAVVADVQRDLLPLYKARDRELQFRAASSLPLVASNRDLLRRIVANFADNALHYADADGVVTLFAQLKRQQDSVRIGVRDYGPRIPAAQWHDLRQMHAKHVSTRPDSSGLGLAIANQFAETIGAQIGAIRHRDGASFYVDVPISKQLSLL